jgi:hypothetical protein
VQACGVDIVQACADLVQWNRDRVCESPALQALGAWPGRNCECLWIPGLAGLKGSFRGDHAGLRSGSLGKHSPGGAKE